MTAVPSIHLSQRAQRTGDQPINYFIKQAVENPHIISLSAGLVDAESLPAAPVLDAFTEILRDPASAQAALQYGTTQGYAPLRQLLVEHIARLDGLTPAALSLTAEDVLVTTGSQQLLYLLSEALLDPGDCAIVEAPSYFVYRGGLESMGVHTHAVPIDEDGMDIDALAALLQRLERSGEIDRLRFIYVVDYFQNPTGLTLSLKRRRQLVELAQRFSRKHRLLILEDAAYRELRYEGSEVPSIKSFDRTNEHVILAMTFSKPCAPGLKTGYGLLPRGVMEAVFRFKDNHDFGSNNLTQFLLHRLMASGAYAAHVAELCRLYRRKCAVLLQALAEAFHTDGTDPDRVRWTHPEGGFYVWLTLPSDLETGQASALMRAALAEGVLYVPGEICYMLDGKAPPRHEMRLSFGVASPEQLREGARRLARAVGRVRPELVAAPRRREQVPR